MTLTAGPLAPPILLAGVLVGGAWVVILGRLLRDGRIGRRLMLTLLWFGLIAMVAPLWWQASWSWYGWHGGSRLAVLHNAGAAYFLLRFIAWGTQLSRHPAGALRPLDTLTWILYAPCMRLGPVLLRREYLERFNAWNPRSPAPWKHILQRFGLFLIGGFFLAVITKNVPAAHEAMSGSDFFSSPELYATGRLLRVFYFVPIQAYLLLWMYNELARAISLWIGIRVDENFDWLPKSTSVREFWQRWHVTVGRWLRNYIYVPIGGGHGLAPLRYAAVFGFCAVWHGASVSFLLWGASQTAALTVQRGWDYVRTQCGWRNLPSNRFWLACCWLVTMHFQLATILVFMDFRHCGLRFFRELWGRLAPLAAS